MAPAVAGRTPPAVPGQAYRHRGLFFASPEELLAAAVPFLAEGLEAGQPALLACRAELNAALFEALGDDERIFLLSEDDVGTGDVRALAARHRLVGRRTTGGASGVRLLVEVAHDDRRSRREWLRFEAACNVALGQLPLSSVCAYDVRGLPEAVRRGVEATHPVLLTASGAVPNDRYVDPVLVLLRAMAPPDPVEATPPTLHLARLTDGDRSPQLRQRLRAVLVPPGGHRQVNADFATAVGEVLDNAFRHGRPPVELRLWVTPTRLVCTVTDQGRGFDDPWAGYRPPSGVAPRVGAGLWLARQTCGSLQATHEGPFTVRLTTTLPEGDTALTRAAGRAAYAEVATNRAERARVRSEGLRSWSRGHASSALGLRQDGRWAARRLAEVSDQVRHRGR
ncbi:anti-sigma factor RsbA family regulatory protein [Geodermatophilus sp. URMC 64]